MYLKRLEIQGFKSFARKTVLEFDKGMISVVGPNGSGKSNFADSLRWVMGEQSMKAIRSKKSEDVIFAGSDKKSKQGMAEVSITFDNSDRKMPLDFSEVNITRRLYRDGESEYLINKRQVRLMDIVEVLSKSGYGGYSYHIISQGTIDQLILSGPTGIKNVIEEASGVKPYYTKREKSIRKLDKTESNLQRVADLVSEIEPRLRSLRRQTKKAEQREELQGQLRGLQESFFSARLHEIGKNLKEKDAQLAFFDKQILELETEAGKLIQQLKQRENDSVKKGNDYQSLQHEIRKVEREKNNVQEELAMVRGQMKAGSAGQPASAHEMRVRESDLKSKLLEVSSAVKALTDKHKLSQKNFDTHKKISSKLQDDAEKLKKKLQTASSPIDFASLKSEVDKIYSGYQSLLYQMKSMQSEDDFRLLRQDAENLEIILVKVRSKISHYGNIEFSQDALRQIHSQIQQIFERREEVLRQQSKIESEIGSLEAQIEFFSQQESDLKRQVESLQEAIKSSGQEGSGSDELTLREKKLNTDLQKFIDTIGELERKLEKYLEDERIEKAQLLDMERELRKKQDIISKTKDQKGLVQIDRARHEAGVEAVLAEIRKNLGNGYVEKLKSQPQESADPGLESKIMKLRAQLESIGTVDDLTMQEYRETDERYQYLTKQAEDLKSASRDLKKVISELDTVIKKQFQNGFNTINDLFSDYFRILFSGGRARMTLLKEVKVSGENEAAEETEDSSGDLSQKEELSGVDIKVTPPGKKLASISALSGGERALTAIALLMAMLTAFPSPFVVLDEVDAALDEANSVRLGKILGKLSHQTQFITITHNRETMRQSGALYGVTMGDDGISKVLSIKLDKAVELAE